MIKVVKIPLIYETELNKNKLEYKQLLDIIFQIQKVVRQAKNKSIQLLWEWNNFSSDYVKNNGRYPKADEAKEIIGTSVGNLLYHTQSKDTIINTGNLSQTLQIVKQEFENSKKDIICGKKSIIDYKSNQPIDLHNKSIRIYFDENLKKYLIDISILSKLGKNNFALNTGTFLFSGIVKDKSTKIILSRVCNGEYKISASKLIYDKKKKQLVLNLTYNFESACEHSLNSDKILGIDLGISKPFMASISGDLNRLFVDGGYYSEIEVFRRRTEQRRRALLRQSKVCGDGRIGHGYKKRTENSRKIEDSISRFRNTINHKYSRAIIDFAVKNNCGVIQMEDLSGISNSCKFKYLKNWSYYDLQLKIENKAKEYGMTVVYIEPRYTSQRCSRCGFIHKDNRPNQETFICQSCGFSENADYNASQNIAIKDIDKLIAQYLKDKCES